MRLGRREILLSALLVLVAVVLSSTVDGQTPKRGGTLRIANTGEPPTLDYSATTVGVTSNIATAIFETPVRLRRELAAPADAGRIPRA